MNNLRNVGCDEEFLAELSGLNAARLAEMVTPLHIAPEEFQPDVKQPVI